MKQIFLAAIVLFLFSCNQNPNKENPESENAKETEAVVNTPSIKVFPKSIGPILEAHGGVAHWDKMSNLCFEIDKPSGKEVHSTALKSRKTRIEHKDWTIGFNGQDVWLDQRVEDAYKGNARFYHNLYFYFYAMPFIVSDPGINYKQLDEPLVVEGKSYPGTLISYNDGVGDSPKDEYVIYRDSDTGQMAWLAYTVTYRDNQKKDEFSYIKYDQWQEVNGLMLPKTLVWYTVEDGKPTAPRNTVEFTKVNMTETHLDESLFTKPEAAAIVPR